MNPDNIYKHRTAHSTTWVIRKGNESISFKIYNGKKTVTIKHGGKVDTYLIECGRRIWHEYIRQGYVQINVCVDHDMDKFYDWKREEEKYGINNAVKDAYVNYALYA